MCVLNFSGICRRTYEFHMFRECMCSENIIIQNAIYGYLQKKGLSGACHINIVVRNCVRAKSYLMPNIKQDQLLCSSIFSIAMYCLMLLQSSTLCASVCLGIVVTITWHRMPVGSSNTAALIMLTVSNSWFVVQTLIDSLLFKCWIAIVRWALIDSCYASTDWQLLCKHWLTVVMQVLIDSCYASTDWQLLCKHGLTVVM